MLVLENVIRVAIASIIGGVTNYLAIKMLFFPKKAWMVGSFKVPFTPGIIPKRHQEIAKSFGGIVNNYLFTPEIIRQWLFRKKVPELIEERLRESLNKWIDQSHTLHEWLNEYIELDNYNLEELSFFKTLKIKDVISAEAVEKWSKQVNQWLSEEIKSTRGEELISHLIEQKQGMVNKLVGLFVNEKKISQMLSDRIRSENFQTEFCNFIKEKYHSFSKMDVDSFCKTYLGISASAWIVNHIGNIQINTSFSSLREYVPRVSKQITESLISSFSSSLGSWMEKIDISNLVKDQVEKFPVDTLERVILEVSGKEFRSITILGFILGAWIGIMQLIIF